ncbi:MAG: DUF4355 domain-containing protein [Lachnospiraceae bacterium]|nr:DUF4355 domain-containing protein [Lachnospiraceae bacterium]
MKTQREPLKMNLQLFASENVAADPTAANDSPKEPEDTKAAENDSSDKEADTKETPNLEELLKDKAFSEAYQKKVDEQVKKALDEKAEQERIASMSPEEKEQKRKEDLDAREKAILEKELRVSATEKLTEANVPKELANLLDYSSAETMETSVKTVVEAFNKAVQAGVDSKLVGGVAMKKAPEETDTVDSDAIMAAINGD